jgi:hypothetical protein
LKSSCISIADKDLDDAGAPAVIIDELWKRLLKAQGMRVMK